MLRYITRTTKIILVLFSLVSILQFASSRNSTSRSIHTRDLDRDLD